MAVVSIIIPVYNTEEYLPRCLDSLIGQTFLDWEAICVDDGSRDGSGAILDEYHSKDHRIKVIHTANGGVSAARNTAMGLAEGKWLMMVDSDDFLHPQAIELCIHFAERDGSDLVAFTYDRRYRTALTLRHFLHIPEGRKTGFRKYDKSCIEALAVDDIFDWATEYAHPHDIPRRWAIKHCQPWRCMYKAFKIKDISFENGIMYEDFLWWSKVMTALGRVTILNLPLYFYYPNFTGYIHSAKQDFRIESLETAISKAEDFYREHATDLQRKKWESHFLIPFKDKLEKKIRCRG